MSVVFAVSIGLVLLSPLGGLIPKAREWFPPWWAIAVPLVAPFSIVVWPDPHADVSTVGAGSVVHGAPTALFIACLALCVAWPFLMHKVRGIPWIFAAAVGGVVISLAAWFLGSITHWL